MNLKIVVINPPTKERQLEMIKEITQLIQEKYH